MLTGPRVEAPALPEARDPRALAAKLSAKVRGGGEAKSPAPAAASPKPAAPAAQPENPAKQPDRQNRGLAPEGSEPEPAAPELAQAKPGDQGSEETPPAHNARTQRKWKALVSKAKNAEGEAASLRAELDAIKAQLGNQQQPQPAAPARKRFEFKEPFPENGSMDEQNRWHIRKEASEMVRAAFDQELPGVLGESFGKFATVISPALQHTVMQMADKRWEGMRGQLESVGASVEEVRPVVEAEIANNPALTIEEALGRVVFSGKFGGWEDDESPAPEPAPAKAPARPAGPARAVTGRFQPQGQKGRELVEQATELRKSGHKMQSQALMGRYLAAMARPRRTA